MPIMDDLKRFTENPSGEHLTAVRFALDMTQAEFAELLGQSQQVISCWELEKRLIRPLVVAGIVSRVMQHVNVRTWEELKDAKP